MKILLVITKAEIGGAQAFVLTLAKGLKDNGHQVSVASGVGNFLPIELKKENIPYFHLKSLKRSINPFIAISFIFELKVLINKEGFDVVHFNSTNVLTGIFSVKMSMYNPKTVFTVHGLSIIDSNYKASILLKISFKVYFKFFTNYIDKIVFVSNYNLAEATNQGIVKNGVVIYNGLEITKDYFLDRDSARRELSKITGQDLTDAYLIGSIGRLAYPKNYEFLIKIWLEIKKIKLASTSHFLNIIILLYYFYYADL